LYKKEKLATTLRSISSTVGRIIECYTRVSLMLGCMISIASCLVEDDLTRQVASTHVRTLGALRTASQVTTN
jgi:hypothetical protein